MRNYALIPHELKTLRQWLIWIKAERNGKWTKIPISPLTGEPASVTNPQTWASFDEAVAAANHCDGIGFVFTSNDPYAGIDLDKSDDPAIWDAHSKIFRATNSYAERSPSGAGCHIIVRGRLPGPGRRKHAVEMYDNARFFTFTGDVIDGRTTILDEQKLIDQLYQELGGPNENRDFNDFERGGSPSEVAGDDDIHNRIRNAAHGKRFARLFKGTWQRRIGDPDGEGYPSQSEADQAICNIIAKHTQNYDQIVRIFHASGLGKRQKAQRPDYLRGLVRRALDKHMPTGAIEAARASVAPHLAKLAQNVVQTPLAAAQDVKITPLGEIKIKSVPWLWYPWLSKRKLHVLYGSPEAGKSTLMLSLAAILSRGGEWPDGSQAPVGNVLIWSGEDEIDDTLAPRLLQMGADKDRLRFIEGSRDPKTGKLRSFQPAIDMPRLMAKLDELKSQYGWTPQIIIIDPLVAMQAGKGDQNSNVDTRAALQVLVDFAIKNDCAAIGIHHSTKGTQGRNLVERISGSLAVGALARITLFATRNRQHDDDLTQPQRLFGRSKGSIGRDTPLTYGYRIKDGPIPVDDPYMENGFVEWLGPIEGSLQDLADAAEKPPDEQAKQTKMDEVNQWLLSNMGAGEEAAESVIMRALAAGISKRTLDRATAKGNENCVVEKIKDGPDSPWKWRLKLEPKPKRR